MKVISTMGVRTTVTFVFTWLCVCQTNVTAEARENGLLAWYRFETGKGVMVKDSGEDSRHGTAVNEPNWVPSPWGTALQILGESYVQMPANAGLNPGKAVTIEAMVRWEGDPEEHQKRTDPFGAAVGNRLGATGYMLGVGSREKKQTAWFVVNGLRRPVGRILVSDARVSAGEWAFLAGAFDGRTLRVWVNETMESMTVPEMDVRPNPKGLTLGAEFPGSSYYRFRGAIDELRVWDRALTAKEIVARYRELRKAATAVAKRPPVPAKPQKLKRTLVVAQDGSGDFNGKTEEPIISAVSAARHGGTVVIRPGIYSIRRVIDLSGTRDLTLRGEDGTVLKLNRIPLTKLSESAARGSRKLSVEDASSFLPRTRIRIKAPGRTVEHRGKKSVIPTFDATVSGVNKNALELSSLLSYPAPKGTFIAAGENLIAINSGTNISLENLTLDGNMQADDPKFVDHTMRCLVLAHGPYGYKAGLTGKPIRGLALRNCEFRNARGRCIAWYAVVESSIINCTASDSPDAGIDIDHFCYDLTITGNRILRCGKGIEINDASRCRIEKNRIEKCHQGIVIWRWCHQDDVNVDNRIRKNVILDSGAYGLGILAENYRNEVTDNRFTRGKGHGILIQGNVNKVANNQVEGFGTHGIFVTGKDNEIIGNKCRSNSSAAPGRDDGIHVTGTGNRVERNVSGDPGKPVQRYGIFVDGEKNTVGENDCRGNKK